MSTLNGDISPLQQAAQYSPIHVGNYYPPTTLYAPPNTRQLTIEAVEGGYLISGYFDGKSHSRTVAVSTKGLAGILKSWAAQFEAKAG